MSEYTIEIIESLAQIDALSWESMNTEAQPFLSYNFLYGLESHGCVCKETGWTPQHLVLYEDAGKQSLIAALPCYIKEHSYGEYIFDWSWADAYHRAGINYYPKLSCATPFTPATTAKWLIHPDYREQVVAEKIVNQLVSFLKKHAIDCQLSSIHALFTESSASQSFTDSGFITRHSSQFHWHNKRLQKSASDDDELTTEQSIDENFFIDFDDYLQTMSSRKRKNIKRERRRVAEQGVTFEWFTGETLTKSVIKQMFGFYLSTTYRYGAQQYLSESFFLHLAENLSTMTHVLIASIDGTPVAGGLFFSSSDRLYGRYWGANADIKDLHFETCYYQPIEYAIKCQFDAFEAGAQGEHKLARGLLPVTTFSQHWLADAGFHSAVLEFTQAEAKNIDNYNKALTAIGPFRNLDEQQKIEI